MKMYYVDVDVCGEPYAIHYVTYCILASSKEEAASLCIERYKGNSEYFRVDAVKEIKEGQLGVYAYYE